ncbi:MAG: hypothetical protein JO224_05485 [Pelomonas sp.]|nr:hypothetical protein [Roseateles sp.]
MSDRRPVPRVLPSEPRADALHALAGRHVALLCADAADPAVRRLVEAVEGLGGQVAQLPPPRPGQRVDTLARVLGQLYDAVDCVGLPAATVAALARASNVPVLDALADAERPLARLLDALAGGGADGAQDRGSGASSR